MARGVPRDYKLLHGIDSGPLGKPMLLVFEHYHTRSDSFELHGVADEPEARGALVHLRRALRHRVAETSAAHVNADGI